MGEYAIHKEIQTRKKTDNMYESFRSTHSFPAQEFIPHPETSKNVSVP